MRIKIALLTTFLLLNGCADKTAKATSKFIKDYKINLKVDEAISKISENLKSKNYTIISTFDHEKEALKLKQMLYPTKTISLYNSKISTKLIQCNASIALEMPIKIAIYSKLNGDTHISYTDPEYWSLKHNIKDADCLNLVMLIKSDINSITTLLGAK